MSKSDPLKIIDKFLLSDQAPENSMGISDLDGFLTGRGRTGTGSPRRMAVSDLGWGKSEVQKHQAG
jgi:hypothetical protein